MRGQKKVLIVDDHPLFREGIKFLISNHPHFTIVGEAGSGKETIEIVKDQKPDLVVMDISLPDKSGIQVTREILRIRSKIRILFVSMHSKIEHIVESFRSGALGYVLKDSVSLKLIQGLEAISRGEYFFDSTVAHKIVQRLLEVPLEEDQIINGNYRKLTARERQVMHLLAEGFSTREVAEKLYISPKTAENHRSSIMKKLCLHNSAELIRYAVQLGLVSGKTWEGEN
ncbi:MAG: response regulator [Desulfovibrionales bacterium]